MAKVILLFNSSWGSGWCWNEEVLLPSRSKVHASSSLLHGAAMTHLPARRAWRIAHRLSGVGELAFSDAK